MKLINSPTILKLLDDLSELSLLNRFCVQISKVKMYSFNALDSLTVQDGLIVERHVRQSH